MHLDRDQLAALSEVLTHGSFDAAAAVLGLSQPAVSLRIRALEDRVGAPLVKRGTPCVATPAGKRLAEHAQTVSLLEHAALNDLDLSTGAGPTRVRIAVNADSLATWFPKVLKHLNDLVVDMQVDDQDHSAEWLERGDVSAAISSLSKAPKGCDVTPLGSQRYIATAAPDFVKRWFADGVTAETLKNAPLVNYSHKDQLQMRWITQVTGKRVYPTCHYLPSTHGFLTAARDGAAWTLNPIHLIKNDLLTGRLVELIPDSPLDLALFWHCNRNIKPALKPLEKIARRIARDALLPPT